MTEMKRFGLRIALWVADVILRGELEPDERDGLKHIRTHLHVTRFEESEPDHA